MFPSSAKGPYPGERRAVERQPGAPLQCRVIDPLDESAVPAGSWNVSSRGVCVVVEPHFAPGSHVEVTFHGPAGGPCVHRMAEVVHTLLVPSLREMWLTGCAFCDDPPDEES